MSTVARGRSGPFWDAVAGRRSVPPAAATLGFEVVHRDPEIAFLEGSLADPSGDVVAGATAVAGVVGFHPATTL